MVRFSNCDFISRRHGMILQTADYEPRICFCETGFDFKAMTRFYEPYCGRIVDYPPHLLRAAILFENI